MNKNALVGEGGGLGASNPPLFLSLSLSSNWVSVGAAQIKLGPPVARNPPHAAKNAAAAASRRPAKDGERVEGESSASRRD